MRANRSLRVAAALLIALLAVALPATAASAQSYPDTPTLTVDRPVVPPCTTVVLTGTGFLPDTLVTITVDGKVIGTVMTDDQGNYTFTYTVPCSEVDGAVLTFTGNDGTNILSVSVTIEAAAVSTTSTTASTSSTGTLPRTGASDTTMLLIRVSVVLVAVGAILVLATNRRKRDHADVDA
ncbi:MAG: hypothetical protein ACXWB2_21410 [Acidimicrobiales bacterium]